MTDNSNFPNLEDEIEDDVVAEEDGDDEDIFTGGFQASEIPAEATFITVRSSNGGTRYVPTSEALTVAAVMQSSGLFVSGAVDYFLDGTRVVSESLIPVGSTLTIIGAVKGG